MSATTESPIDQSSSVLVAKPELPPEFAWFNELDVEERNDFFIGLLEILFSDGADLKVKIDEYLRGWQATVEITSNPDFVEEFKRAKKSQLHGPYSSFEEAFGGV
jgi:hypothetical protein